MRTQVVVGKHLGVNAEQGDVVPDRLRSNARAFKQICLGGHVSPSSHASVSNRINDEVGNQLAIIDAPALCKFAALGGLYHHVQTTHPVEHTRWPIDLGAEHGVIGFAMQATSTLTCK